MAGERLTLWTSAAAAGATLVAVAFSAVVIWNVSSKQRAHFATELAALNTKLDAANAKIDKAGETVAEIKKITALENTTQQLALLNSEIKKTNDGLAALRQSSSLDGIKATLATLESKIEKTGAVLAELKKPAPIDGIKSEFDGLKAELASLTAKIDTRAGTADKTLAEIKTASLKAADAQAAGDAVRDKALVKLDSAIGDLKTGIAGLKTDLANTASLRAKSLDTIAKSIDTLSAPVVAKVEKAPEAAPEPPAIETTASIPVTQPLTVRFDNKGRANLDAQTVAVVGNLRTVMKDRRNCAISVAGYSDTYGRDDANLDVSQQRADMVSAKLKTAFAGQPVQIDSVGWGERRLKVWTPDGKVEMANRRVEVSIDCRG